MASNAENVSIWWRHHVTAETELDVKSEHWNHKVVYTQSLQALFYKCNQGANLNLFFFSSKCTTTIVRFRRDSSHSTILHDFVSKKTITDYKFPFIYLICIWGLWRQKQLSEAGLSNCIPQSTLGYNYLSLPEIPASGAKVLNMSMTNTCQQKWSTSYDGWYGNMQKRIFLLGLSQQKMSVINLHPWDICHLCPG